MSSSPTLENKKRKQKPLKGKEDLSQVDNEVSETQTNKLQPDSLKPGQSRLGKFMLRTVTGLIMIFAFLFLLLYTNHMVISGFVILLQIIVYKEMVALRFKEAKERNLAAFRTLNWYFLFITMYYIYGAGFLAVLKTYTYIPQHLLTRHSWYSFVLYIIGFCGFVFSLRRQTLKYQFGQITWTLMTILIVVVQSHFILKNINEGLIWFLLPHSLIICNDIMAYFVGISIGRKFTNRPLTSLSPNKTWEGFIGAIILTIIYAFIASRVLGQFEWFRCSTSQLASGGCQEGLLFTPLPISQVFEDYLPKSLSFLGDYTVTRIQLHSVVFALFSSIIAPFGGFLASAMKRAYQKKDFDQIIPGHGGATDRFDCQFIIGLFTYVYYTTWIKIQGPDVSNLILTILSLPETQQMRIVEVVQKSLTMSGVN